MIDVVCSSCGRSIGKTPSRYKGFIYCPEPERMCHTMPHNSASEERDSLIVFLSQRGDTAASIGRLFSITYQAVLKIVNRRTNF